MSVRKIIPSALTLLGLCCGATSMAFALVQDWKAAVVAILCAMLFDMLDGAAARWLGADSRFGAQLDSLADLVSFGVAPAVVVYAWSLSDLGPVGWIAALIFCVCAAIRLARFNVESVRFEGATQSDPFFVGLPTPAAAGLMLAPMLMSFEFGPAPFRHPLVCIGMIAFTSMLMLSRVPTPSLKYVRVNLSGWIALVAALVVAAVYFHWAALVLGLLLYLATIPIVIHRSRLAAAIVQRRNATATVYEDVRD